MANPPRRPIWLVAFDQEEWGMVGSAALAQELREARQRLKLMVSLEMLAFTSEQQSYPVAAMEAVYGHRGDFIALVPNCGSAIPDVRLSDHSPFSDAGTNALMVKDTT